MPYCVVAELSDYVLQAYLDKLEELNPGILQKHIDGVSAEIDDVLRSRFQLPLQSVPETLARICTVMAAYRAVGSITSLMQSEGGSSNEWLPLQTMHKQALKDLADIRDGKIDLGLEELGEVTIEADTVETTAPARIFDDDAWSKF
jgi:phage gp36-like protein